MLFRAHNTFINTGRLPTVDISFVKKKNWEKILKSYIGVKKWRPKVENEKKNILVI